MNYNHSDCLQSSSNLTFKKEGGLRLLDSSDHAQSEPLVTIVTVVFNARDDIIDTITSVINQDCNNFEFIVVDGGSTDGTVDLIREYENSINYWVSEPDSGIYDAMNKGLNSGFIVVGDDAADSAGGTQYLHRDITAVGTITINAALTNS